MKGQTTIELKDTKTGKIERYVDNNMMTSAIEEIFKTRGLIAQNGFPNNELVKSCLGGILLFDNALTENASNVFPPPSVSMVGNGAVDVVSTDDVTEMGSFNSNESGWQADGSYLAVYDFNTSQGNGTIASVCLTSDICGYIGFGNQSSIKRKTLLKAAYTYGGSFSPLYSIYGNYTVRMDYTASTIDVIPASYFNADSPDYFLTSKKLKIVKYQIPMTKLNLKGTATELTKISEVELTIPDEYVNYFSGQFDLGFDDGNIYIYSRGWGLWSSELTYKILKISNANVISIISLFNTTGDSINSNYTFKAIYSGEYMVLIASDISKVYIINLSDSSAREAINPDNDAINNYEDYWLNKGGYIFVRGKVIKVSTAEILYVNGYGFNNVMMLNVSNHPLMLFNYSSGGEAAPRVSSMYLASINNLDTPVVKTAEKTMKISYRITF